MQQPGLHPLPCPATAAAAPYRALRPPYLAAGCNACATVHEQQQQQQQCAAVHEQQQAAVQIAGSIRLLCMRNSSNSRPECMCCRASAAAVHEQ
ncbi:hypothetical protein HaLaN_30525, partial [Haematococcus lacustris]